MRHGNVRHAPSHNFSPVGQGGSAQEKGNSSLVEAFELSGRWIRKLDQEVTPRDRLILGQKGLSAVMEPRVRLPDNLRRLMSHNSVIGETLSPLREELALWLALLCQPPLERGTVMGHRQTSLR